MKQLKPLPWFKCSATSWLEDDDLQDCSFEAQGLWMNMICMMHKSSHYGLLCDKAGRPLTPETIASRLGKDVRIVRRLLAELESHSVFSRAGTFDELPAELRLSCDVATIVSRRLIRDEISRISAIENGSRGGNRKLFKHLEEQRQKGGVNPPVDHAVNPTDKLKSLEYKSIRENSISSTSETSAAPEPTEARDSKIQENEPRTTEPAREQGPNFVPLFDPPADWLKFRDKAERRSIAGTEAEWSRAFYEHWKNFPMETKLQASDGLQWRKLTQETEPQFLTRPDKYIAEHQWERTSHLKDLKRKTNGSAKVDASVQATNEYLASVERLERRLKARNN